MERLRQIAEVGLGVVLAATPVALWIAWTPGLVVCVMLAAAASSALLVLLVEWAQEHAPVPLREEDVAGAAQLPEEFIEEVHRLFPLTYHHSRRPTSRFRETMVRLTEMIEGNRRHKAPR